MKADGKNVFELSDLRNRVRMFRDRAHAGRILADMLGSYRAGDAIVLAIPAGGVPVAAVLARALALPLDVTVVSKITLPWNTESGYGAVAFDGTVRLNENLVAALALGDAVVQNGIARTNSKVAGRVERLRGDRAFPALAGRTAILVDDGLASGFTMLVAVEAVHRQGVARIVVAAPTGHAEAVRKIAAAADAIYCANIREGHSFAVADAYERWADVDEDAALAILEDFEAETQREAAKAQRPVVAPTT